MEKFKTIHENQVLINPPDLDSRIEKVANKILRQYLRGQNCEKTNAIYRELIKQKYGRYSKM
jgi:hypothetical protein